MQAAPASGLINRFEADAIKLVLSCGENAAFILGRAIRNRTLSAYISADRS